MKVTRKEIFVTRFNLSKSNVYLQNAQEFIIHKEKSNKMQQCIKILLYPYLYEARHVSGDTPPIIRSLKLHWQPLVFHKWKVVGRVVGGRC
jgi:hypothetical protein